MTTRKPAKPAPRKASRTKSPAKKRVRKPAASASAKAPIDRAELNARNPSHPDFDSERFGVLGIDGLPDTRAALEPGKALLHGDWTPRPPRLSNEDLCAVQRLLDNGHVRDIDTAAAKVRELRYGYSTPMVVGMVDMGRDEITASTAHAGWDALNAAADRFTRTASSAMAAAGEAALNCSASVSFNVTEDAPSTESHLRELDAYVSVVGFNLDALVLQLGPILRAPVQGLASRETNQAGCAESSVAPAYSPLTGRVMGLRQRLARLLGVIEDATLQLDLPVPAPVKA